MSGSDQKSLEISFLLIGRVQKDVKELILLSGLLCALLIGLSYPFMLRFGIAGVGYSWVASSGIDRCGGWWRNGEKGRAGLDAVPMRFYLARYLLASRAFQALPAQHLQEKSLSSATKHNM
jgi:hypothetical protein